MDTRTRYFEDVAVSLDYWKKTAAESLSNHNAELLWTDNPGLFQKIVVAIESQGVSTGDVATVMEEILRGFATSLLTILDGGTATSEHTTLTLTDSDGIALTELREGFLSYLFDTNRLH